MDAVTRAVDAHRMRWGEPELLSRAPGRVNLIGEHTDYNDGYCLPMALPFDTAVVISRDGDPDHGEVTIESHGFGEVSFDPHADPRSVPAWALHIAGTIALLAAEGIASGGWRATVDSDIPIGASLSSSAAIEVAVASGVLALTGREWDPIAIARLGQRVEHEVVGVPTGIMDQLISAGAVAGHASLMDCRALTLTPVPLPAGAVVAIIDSGTRRRLVEAAYADRRAACERAAAALGVDALRDATVARLDSITDDVDRRRARHVVTENARTLAAVAAMRAGDVVSLGNLMSESHTSLRDDFEVSGPGLDAVVTIAESVPGCLGARMTGGGFAGCAVALVETSAADAFTRAVVERYDYDGNTARVWIYAPAAGASVSRV